MNENIAESKPAALRKAVALISGGLDSMLAARTILEQGVHVEGINFFTGFCVEGHTHAIRRRANGSGANPRNNALWVAEQLGIQLHLIDVVEEYKRVVLNPKHGYGANLNPCLDCKTFMVGRAREWMEEQGFDFIITGEVIGQRPKSQRRETMPVVASESGADDRLLRPLCAKRLPETLPEREGWVDRERLHDFTGRSRKPQFALAADFGIEDYAQPAGGCCFLTDRQYSTKLADLWASRGARDYDLDDIMLLKVGRHLRPRPHFKVIVGREEGGEQLPERLPRPVRPPADGEPPGPRSPLWTGSRTTRTSISPPALPPGSARAGMRRTWRWRSAAETVRPVASRSLPWRRVRSRPSGTSEPRMARATLDARRLLCPLPVIRTQERVKGLAPGDTLEVTCTDPGALHDIPAWCRLNGHLVTGTAEDRTAHELVITIVVGAAAGQRG